MGKRRAGRKWTTPVTTVGNRVREKEKRKRERNLREQYEREDKE